DERAVPAGPTHAVTGDGRALCRNSRPRFTWPGLTWSGSTGSGSAAADDAPCPLCVQVQRSQQVFATVPAYPGEPQAAVATATATAASMVPEQPPGDSGEPVWS